MQLPERLRISTSKRFHLKQPDSGIGADDGPSNQRAHDSWTPHALRRGTLLAFAVAIAVIAIVLGILALISHRHNGLCRAEAGLHYLWTYAPTALFTSLAILWSQTEYRAKQMQPWRGMADGPTDASQSVLLDYVSRWNVLVLYQALKRRQVVVIAAVTISLLLKLLIVLSTGLFVLAEIEVNSNRSSLVLKDKFISSGADFHTWQVDPRPAAIVMGMAKEKLPLPSGTTREAAFQQFTLPEELGTNVLTTETMVDTLSSHLECERADIHVTWNSWNATARNGSTHVVTRPCIDRMTSATCHVTLPWCEDLREAAFTPVNCSQSEQEDPQRLWVGINSRKQTIEESVSNASQMICKPVYTLRTMLGRASRGSTVELEEVAHHSSSSIPGFDAWQLANAYEYSIPASAQLMSRDDGYEAGGVNPFFVFLNITDPRPSFDDLLDINLLNSTLQNAWSAFTTQFFNLYLRTPMESAASGSVVTMEDRLLIRDFSLWPVELCLAIVFALNLVMWFDSFDYLIPYDPVSIMGLGMVLAKSGSLVAALRDSGLASVPQLAERLAKGRFQTTTGIHIDSSSEFAIEYLRDSLSVENKLTGMSDNKVESAQWYQPFPVTLGYRFALPVALIGLIASLELLLHHSQGHNGLIDIPSSDSYEHLAWTYLPTLIMVAVASLISMRHSTIQIFGPYIALWKGSGHAQRSVLKRPFTSSALWTQWRDREVFLITSSLCVVLAAFLTVAASGLYSAVLVITSDRVLLQQQDWFMHHTMRSTDVSLQINMVLVGNLTYPKFTFDDLALSRPNLVRLDSNGTLSSLVPSVRGRLTCGVVPRTQIIGTNISHTSFSLPEDHKKSLYVYLSENACYRQSSQPGAMTWYPISGYTDIQEMYPSAKSVVEIQLPQSGFFGTMSYTYDLLSSQDDPQCEPLLGSFGRVHEGELESTLFYCTPVVETVKANVTFRLPGMEIESAIPPIVDERSSKIFDMKYAPHLGVPLTAIEGQGGSAIGFPPGENFYLDSFMVLLAYGSRGIPLKQLLGPENTGKLFAAISHLYGLGFAQMMNNFRIPTSKQNATTFEGIVTTPNGSRLMQSALSTRLLEALLAAILICFLVSDFTTNTKRVLPKNPCSIAAVASLLVDSLLLDMLATGSVQPKEKDLMANFDRYVFSMGYFKIPGNKLGSRRFGIDVGSAEHTN